MKEALGRRGLSQVELARSLDLGESALSKSINGNRAFSAVELAEVANRLDVSMRWLVTGEPVPMRFESLRGMTMIARRGPTRVTCRVIVRLLRVSYSSIDRLSWRECS